MYSPRIIFICSEWLWFVTTSLLPLIESVRSEFERSAWHSHNTIFVPRQLKLLAKMLTTWSSLSWLVPLFFSLLVSKSYVFTWRSFIHDWFENMVILLFKEETDGKWSLTKYASAAVNNVQTLTAMSFYRSIIWVTLLSESTMKWYEVKRNGASVQNF